MDLLVEKLQKAAYKYGEDDILFMMNNAIFSYGKYNDFFMKKKLNECDISEQWDKEYCSGSSLDENQALKKELQELREQNEQAKSVVYQASKKALQELREKNELERNVDYEASKKALQELRDQNMYTKCVNKIKKKKWKQFKR